MFRIFLLFSFIVILFVSCTENTDSQYNQEDVDEMRRQEKIENEQKFEENQQDYKVRRIPAKQDNPRPDDD
jgi:sortase (surface protein transpeptidase)